MYCNCDQYTVVGETKENLALRLLLISTGAFSKFGKEVFLPQTRRARGEGIENLQLKRRRECKSFPVCAYMLKFPAKY